MFLCVVVGDRKQAADQGFKMAAKLKKKVNGTAGAKTGKKTPAGNRTNISINLSVDKARRFQKATDEMQLKPSMVLRAFIEMFADRNPIVEDFVSELETKRVKYFKYG